MPSGERVTSFTKGNNANFSCEKWQNEAFRGVYVLRRREKTSAQISYSQSSSSSYLKVSNVMLRGNLRRKRFVACVADEIYSRLVTSAKQRPNPRSGPPNGLNELGYPHKMFRFPSPSLSWRWIGRLGKKKKKNEHMIAY